MAKTKDRIDYQAISLPKEFVKKVRDYVFEHDEYRSIAEFTQAAVREKMDETAELERRITKLKAIFDNFEVGRM